MGFNREIENARSNGRAAFDRKFGITLAALATHQISETGVRQAQRVIEE